MAVHMKAVSWGIGCLLMASWAGLAAAETPKAKVELRWVESKRVEGLTEDKGFQSSCDPEAIVYAHKKPALTLTAKTVADVELKNLDLSKNGLSSNNYNVTLHLTPEARQELAKSCPGDDTQYLTVVIDGKFWGLRRYEKKDTSPGVPHQARAESFVPDVGFFSSEAEANRVAQAVK